MKNQLIRFVLGFSVVLTLACTKERPAELPDGQELGVFTKEYLSSAVMQIGGVSEIQGLDANTITYLRVDRVSGPEDLKYMFKDLSFVGALSQAYQVQYVLNADSVIAVKILDADEPLVAEDRELATRDGDVYRIPLFKYKAEYGKLVRSRNDLGEVTSTLRFEPANFNEATHVKIDTTLEARIIIQDIDVLSSPKNLAKADVYGKEYLYRRTLQDVPNEFAFSYIGASTNLEIVKFEFKRDKVDIVRADVLTDRGNNNSIDREVLMTIPVTKYKKAIYRDANGQRLALPKFEETTHNDPEAIAELDWAQDAVLSGLSPLSIYQFGQCFYATGSPEVSSVRKDLKKGHFNFTLIGTYGANISNHCAGYFLGSYFDVNQVNFTFKERVSFQEYIRSDEKPALDVPYTAQKLLGFGLFTYHKNNPNAGGNIGTDGTKIPLPAVFDIKNGKKITYVLGGLPENNSTERDAIIQATREVIKDLNDGFRKALAPSPTMARTDDVIELLIEGVDIAKGELGDIDRNYIWYVDKAGEIGLLGLGGSHQNPRSGRVEAGSVFLYGGNIKSYADSILRSNTEKLKYERTMAQVQEISEAGADAVEGETVEVEDIEVGDMTAQSLQRQSSADVSPSLRMNDAKVRLRSQAYRSQSYRNGLSAMALNSRALESILSPEALTMLETFREAVELGEAQNATAVASIYSEKMLKYLGHKFSPQQKQMIAKMSAKQKIKDIATKNLRNANFCAYDMSEAVIAASAEDYDLNRCQRQTDPAACEKQMRLNLLVAIYKPTLAHEIGHNLGLRHNFIGSYDKANFKHDENDESKRDYSSVMDYMANDHLSYDGLGPYDVAALRAAYTGLIELSEAALGKVDPKKLVGGKFIHVDDYKALVLGANGSWLNLSEDVVERLPLKGYKFCSDEDAGVYPTCNRFDEGTTPEEIVANKINDYRASYGYRNFPLDRLEFEYWQVGHYIGRLLRDFTQIRQFLEEGFYLAIKGKSQEEYVPHLLASIDGMQFFQSVIATPEAFSEMKPEERFVRVETQLRQEDGTVKKVRVPVELKWTNDRLFNNGTDRLAIRGNELDKLVALITLTERSFGFSRYEQASLRISFPEMERLLLVPQGESALTAPTMQFLTAIINDKLPALAHNPVNGALFGLPGSFAAENSEAVRIYAILGAIQFLDVSGLEEKDNLSSFFRVLSGFKAPSGKTKVADLGASLSSQTVLKYFVDNSNEASKLVIDSMDALAQLHGKASKLEPLVGEWLALKLQGLPDDDAGVVEKVTKINEIVDSLPKTLEQRDFNEISGLMVAIVNMAAQLKQVEDQVGKPDGPSLEDFNMLLEDRSNLILAVAKSNPLLLGMLRMMPDLSEDLGQSSQILHKNALERHYGLMLSNMRLLNMLFYAAHPEYKR